MRTFLSSAMIVLAAACGSSSKSEPEPEPTPGSTPDASTPVDSGTEDSSGPIGTTACPTVGDAVKKGTVASAQLKEASGLATSRKSPGILWTHNDSGDTARVFALRADDAQVVAEVKIDGATAIDWEAIAAAPYEGTPSLFIGDIGDNDRKRAKVTIYVVPEPGVAPAPASVAVTKAIDLVYEDGAKNAEALLVDPVGGAIVIVTKEETGRSGIYVADPSAGKLVRKGELAFGVAPLTGDVLVTDGAISADGSMIALRTYTSAFLWPRATGASIAGTLTTVAPCALRTQVETQGEAIAFDDSGRNYFTTSEKQSQPLWSFALTK